MNRRICFAMAIAPLVAVIERPVAASFVNFESGHVRPLALSPSRNLLLAVNTPDNRLEVFRVTASGLERAGEAVVGMEPVAVAMRSESEAYVVNHLSDSVSVVDLSDPEHPFVRATLLVGDEPRDVVLAGPAHDKVFIATAHRGQNNPNDPRLSTPGVGRADVWVFNAADLSQPASIVTLFADTPRALAATPDGLRVYAAAFHSGNQTTALNTLAVTNDLTANNRINDGFRAPGMPAPTAIVSGPHAGTPAPQSGTILKLDEPSGQWRDSAGRDWTRRVRFNLPDRDVFAIDAAANPPVEVESFRHVGTVIFNLEVNPATGKVYATNLESQNHIRFEPTVSGHIAESRVTILDGAAVTPVHLNPHIDYSMRSGPPTEIAQSLAFPLGMAFEPDGQTLYVAAFGSGKIGVLDENAQVVAQIPVGGGPSGVVLDPMRQRLFVMNRFDHTISIVDTAARSEIGAVALRYTPEPEDVRAGRPVLYDSVASGHGDSSCASCHIFADFDSLAWDLGDPGGTVEDNPVPRVAIQGNNPLQDFHPMKGPMTTQSLRGMDAAGAMHWRGDRNGVNGGSPSPDVFDEGQAFLHFRPAFQGLLGKETELSTSDMERFRDFILTVRYPPNPIAHIDGTLTAQETAGKQIFDSNGSRTGLGGDGNRCADCHALPLGTGGRGSFELETQEFKVAHLRNLYQKVGMFGYALPDIVNEPGILGPAPTPHRGDQVRGYGYIHDGSIPNLFNFFRVPFLPAAPFTFVNQAGRSGDQKVRELEAFLLGFDTGLKPVVGHQVTLTAANLAANTPRYNTLRGRADTGDCDLVVHGVVSGLARGYFYLGGLSFQSDREAEQTTEGALAAAIGGGAILTVTAVPRGCGQRIGVDRDEDDHFDRDELDAGSDPADPLSVPGGMIAFLRGNCNGDAALDLSDPVFWLGFLFQGGQAPVCREACEANLDGRFDISDAVYELLFLFNGGQAPGLYPACEPRTGDCVADVCP